MLLEISQNFYLLCSSCFHYALHASIMLFMLPLCSNMNNIDAKILLLECFIRVFYDVRIGLFDSICEFQCILNIEQFNTLHCIFI